MKKFLYLVALVCLVDATYFFNNVYAMELSNLDLVVVKTEPGFELNVDIVEPIISEEELTVDDVLAQLRLVCKTYNDRFAAIARARFIQYFNRIEAVANMIVKFYNDKIELESVLKRSSNARVTRGDRSGRSVRAQNLQTVIAKNVEDQTMLAESINDLLALCRADDDLFIRSESNEYVTSMADYYAEVYSSYDARAINQEQEQMLIILLQKLLLVAKFLYEQEVAANGAINGLVDHVLNPSNTSKMSMTYKLLGGALGTAILVAIALKGCNLAGHCQNSQALDQLVHVLRCLAKGFVSGINEECA